MTRRHDLYRHQQKLGEIRNIMRSMKTLSIMETHKLERIIDAQKNMFESIETIATDFLHFYPQVLPVTETTSNIILLIGSERGFCGDFNEQLVTQLDKSFTDDVLAGTVFIAVGSKLSSLLQDTYHDINIIEGANVVEEINNVVDALVNAFAHFEQPISIHALHHDGRDDGLATERLLPPFQELLETKPDEKNEPLLNLTAHEFFIELTDHYLFSTIHRILYFSLMAENQNRTRHLENAIHHLDEKTEQLKYKINTLRKEEIIEEIEVILLSVPRV